MGEYRKGGGEVTRKIPTIMLLDNNQFLVRSLSRALEAWGYDVCLFSDAESAEHFFLKEEAKVNLALIHANLGQGTKRAGVEFACEGIRLSNHRYINIPILIYSFEKVKFLGEFSKKRFGLDFFNTPAWHFISCPIRMTNLYKKLQEVFAEPLWTVEDVVTLTSQARLAIIAEAFSELFHGESHDIVNKGFGPCRFAISAFLGRDEANVSGLIQEFERKKWWIVLEEQIQKIRQQLKMSFGMESRIETPFLKELTQMETSIQKFKDYVHYVEVYKRHEQIPQVGVAQLKSRSQEAIACIDILKEVLTQIETKRNLLKKGKSQ
jgi:CheY-like chemotaxis protein